MDEKRILPWGARAESEPAGRGIAVFVIDSGVNPAHSHVKEVSGGARVFKEPGGTIQCEEGGFQDDLGHGTAITAVIRHVAPAARIFAIKIFSGSLHATVDVLEAAMEYAMTARARVINLSLGTDRM
jgi:subtilisin family serine protease